jgi:lipopolysaccharide biosynthesis glycosyltransferase
MAQSSDDSAMSCPTRRTATEPAHALMHVVVAGDAAYEPPLHACLASVMEHAPDASIQVLDCGLGESSRAALVTTAGGSERLSFTLAPMTLFARLPAPACGSMATYARLLLDELVAADRFLYLDADTLVVAPLEPLFEVELRSHPLAAVREMYTPTVSAANGVLDWRALGLHADTPYFNAGVMLIDRDRWRALDVGANAIGYLGDPARRVTLYDQEALNVALAGSWLELPPYWNVSRYWYKPERRGAPHADVLAQARIHHFLSEDKPWRARSAVPPTQTAAFYRAIDRSAISGWRPDARC